MKPELDSIIWEIKNGFPKRQKAEFLGRESFLVAGSYHREYDEYLYEDYGITWFKSFEDAEAYLEAEE